VNNIDVIETPALIIFLNVCDLFLDTGMACNEIDEEIMTDEHKDNLINNRKELVANIHMHYIINYLESKKLVLSRDVQKIKDKIGDEQAEYFLDILRKRPDSAYYTFITLLRNTDQEHVANILEPPKKESRSRGNVLSIWYKFTTVFSMCTLAKMFIP